MFRRKNKFPVQGRVPPCKNLSNRKLVLITGGSQGLGEAIAIKLAKKGANIVLVSRSEEKLKLAISKVEAARVSPEQKFTFYSADLTNAEEAKKAITSCENVPDIVICCAGVAIPGFFADQSPEILEDSLKTIYLTTLWTAHAAINAMIRSPQPSKSPHRKIVFTASLLSFTAIPGWTSYAPARAAIRMLADTLREECLLYDIDIHCTFPANILTPGFEVEEKTKPALTREFEGTPGAESAEIVAQRIIKKLERGDKHITYGFVGSMLKNMMAGMTERDSAVSDSVSGCIGCMVWPFVRSSWRRKIRAYKVQHEKRELPPWP